MCFDREYIRPFNSSKIIGKPLPAPSDRNAPIITSYQLNFVCINDGSSYETIFLDEMILLCYLGSLTLITGVSSHLPVHFNMLLRRLKRQIEERELRYVGLQYQSFAHLCGEILTYSNLVCPLNNLVL